MRDIQIEIPNEQTIKKNVVIEQDKYFYIVNFLWKGKVCSEKWVKASFGKKKLTHEDKECFVSITVKEIQKSILENKERKIKIHYEPFYHFFRSRKCL